MADVAGLAESILQLIDTVSFVTCYEADPEDRSPTDAIGHTLGLIWQAAMAFLHDTEGSLSAKSCPECSELLRQVVYRLPIGPLSLSKELEVYIVFCSQCGLVQVQDWRLCAQR